MPRPPIRIDPTLGRALEQHQAGRLREAEQGYIATLDQHPEHPVALLYLGVLRYEDRRLEEAVRLIGRSIELNPREPAAYNHLGLVLLARQEMQQAVHSFETALRLKPGYTDAMNNLANVLKKMQRHEEAERLFRQILCEAPRHVHACYNLGLMLFELHRFEEAERQFVKTLELAPDFHKAHYQLGLAAENMGHFEDAIARYERVLRVMPDHFRAMAALLALRDYQPQQALIEKAERMAAREDLPEPESYTVCYGLAKRFERRRDYDKAFHYLRLANTRRSRGRKYEPQRVEQLFGQYRQVFTRELIRRHAAHDEPCERPVFVLGMPRTGTTLTEQILAAHPEVFGAGELPDLPAIANRLPAAMSEALGRAVPEYPLCLEFLDGERVRSMIQSYTNVLERCDAKARRIVDKNPFNFLNVGLIAILFPRARIVHCHRHPLDVGISCYMERFELKHDFTTDFGHFAHYYAQYRRLMAHWSAVLDGPILDVPYETLVSDTQKVSREIIAFCGLPWNDACLAHQQTGRAVLTPSRWQVRQPIYRSSIGRWRNYEAYLDPLKQALAAYGVPWNEAQP